MGNIPRGQVRVHILNFSHSKTKHGLNFPSTHVPFLYLIFSRWIKGWIPNPFQFIVRSFYDTRTRSHNSSCMAWDTNTTSPLPFPSPPLHRPCESHKQIELWFWNRAAAEIILYTNSCILFLQRTVRGLRVWLILRWFSVIVWDYVPWANRENWYFL